MTDEGLARQQPRVPHFLTTRYCVATSRIRLSGVLFDECDEFVTADEPVREPRDRVTVPE